MHPPRTLFCTALLAASAFTPHAHTQTTTSKPGADPASDASQKPATLSLSANLVNLPVIVRDKKGALIQTLSKGDFELSVDGHAQTIRYFDHDANLPLTLGLLVDTSRSQRSVLDEERDASSAFLEDMLGPTSAPGDKPGGSAVKSGGSAEKPGGSAEKPDRAFIVQFARETELLQDLTNSRPKLQAGLKQIGTDNPNTATSTDEDSDGNSGRSAHHAGGTTLYDAVFLSGDELMQKQQGRKALIILSDGVDRNSKETLNRAIEAAQRADTIIYAIYFKGEERGGSSNRGGGFPGNRGGGFPGGGYPGGGGGYPGGGGRRGGSGGGRQDEPVDGKKILQKMADETGGRFFEVKGKQKVSEIYTQIAEELRTQYRLGYTPDQTITGDGYHQVDLRVPAQKTLRIQTRDGYYTGK